MSGFTKCSVIKKILDILQALEAMHFSTLSHRYLPGKKPACYLAQRAHTSLCQSVQRDGGLAGAGARTKIIRLTVSRKFAKQMQYTVGNARKDKVLYSIWLYPLPAAKCPVNLTLYSTKEKQRSYYQKSPQLQCLGQTRVPVQSGLEVQKTKGKHREEECVYVKTRAYSRHEPVEHDPAEVGLNTAQQLQLEVVTQAKGAPVARTCAAETGLAAERQTCVQSPRLHTTQGPDSTDT